MGMYSKKEIIPESLNTIDEVEHLLTSILFASSVQHAAEGCALFDIYGNPAAHPWMMRCPAPTEKGSVSMDRIMDTLPDQDTMCVQMTAAYALSWYPTDEVFMGEFPMKLLTGVDELAVQEQFTRDVRQLGNEITNRNLTWTAPYNYLHPKNVAFRIDL